MDQRIPSFGNGPSWTPSDSLAGFPWHQSAAGGGTPLQWTMQPFPYLDVGTTFGSEWSGGDLPELHPSRWPSFPNSLSASASFQPFTMLVPPSRAPPVMPPTLVQCDTVVLIWNLHQQTYCNRAKIREALAELDFDIKTIQRLGNDGAFVLTVANEGHAKCLVIALDGSRHLDTRAFLTPLRLIAFGLWGGWMDAVDDDMPEWPVQLQIAHRASIRKSQTDWNSALRDLCW